MATMRDFWARERLLRHIGERHDTDDVSRIIEIAKTAGYLDQSGCCQTNEPKHQYSYDGYIL